MPDPNAETSSELLVRYVRQALERIERGEPVDPATLCAEHPQLAAMVAEALGIADQLSALVPSAAAAAATDPLAGHRLTGRYRLEHCLGRGAMGVVYRAHDGELRRDVAVKILDARLFADATAEQRFRREAEALAALDHASVVTVFDRGRTDEGIHFLVMELLDGCSLASILRRCDEDGGGDGLAAARALLETELPEANWWRQCARWGAELADGLAAAHAKGLVHRDVKPSNIWIRRDGRALLLDFGIAARAGDATLTATVGTLGTPWYMAPEQVRRGDSQAAPTLDVYGLSATLYHLLSNQLPYEGTATAVLAALQSHDPQPLLRLRPDLPRDLVAIVEHGMERDLRRRYGTALGLGADLRAFLEHRPVSVRPLGAVTRRWRSIRRRPARAFAAVAVLLAVILFGVALPLWQWQRGRDVAAEKQRLEAALPALLAVEGQPSERLLAEFRAEAGEGEAVLSRILELDPDDLPARLFRGALRLDRGEHQAAAADFELMAQQHEDPYFRALAQRYLQADPKLAGTGAVRVDGLPEPTTPLAHFVAGFHELRNRDVDGFEDRALLHLQAAGDYAPAQDLLVIALVAKADAATSRRERERLFQQAVDTTLLLDGRYGHPTARTLAMRGAALCGLKRYEEAIAPLEQSLQLRPDRHSPHQNLGVALHRLGRLDEAEQHLQAAYRLHPFAWNTCYTLAQLCRDRGDFAKAYEWAERVPKQGPQGLAWKQPDLEGNIAMAQAFTLRASDEPGALAASQRAADAFARAEVAAPSTATRQRLQVCRGVVAAMQRGDVDAAIVDFANLAQLTPGDPYQIANVARLLPANGLGTAATRAIGIYLRRLAEAVAGGDERLKAKLREEIAAAARAAAEVR